MWPPQRRIGQLLGGKYRVQQLLALGGMGVIFGACHELTGRSVVVKLLRPELATRPDLMRRLSVEARLAVEAAHPNVVEVLDAGADERGVPYLVLERLYGQPLEMLIDQPLELFATLQALAPVMNALVSLHAAGIVHRDIKPSNIFLSIEGDRIRPKLLDFGIAKVLSGGDSTLSNVALGTPSYMAPEQALGCVALGPTTDVWSMAVVLVRCLTGRLPFACFPDTGPSALQFGLNPNELENVPESVGRVLSRALRLDPRDRFPSMAELRAELSLALRSVDAHANWPDEATISYATQDFALADGLLPSSAKSFESGLRGDERPARPQDLGTRTLPNPEQRAPWSWRRRAIGALGLLGATLVTFTSRESRSPSSVPSGQEPTSSAAPAIDTAEPPARPNETETSPGVYALADGTKADRAEPALVHPSASRAIPPRQPRRPAPADLLDARQSSQSIAPVDVPLGPNRSPIIE